jgi:hypothetical protein
MAKVAALWPCASVAPADLRPQPAERLAALVAAYSILLAALKRRRPGA